MKLDSGPKFSYEFVDETTKLCRQHAIGTLTAPSMSSDRSCLSNTSIMDKVTGITETPALSVCVNIFDKPDR